MNSDGPPISVRKSVDLLSGKGKLFLRVKGQRCFTLVELMVVMAITALLIAVSVSSFAAAMGSSNLTNGGQSVVSLISLARQEAVTRNEQVEVLFYQLPRGATLNWCGIQVWRIEQTDSGTATNAVTPLVMVPEGVMLASNSTLSPLLTAEPNMPGSMSLANHGNVTFSGFSFRPNGSPDYNINTGNNVLTIQNVSGGSSPKNYFTLKVDPVGGKISVYRP